MVHPAGHPALYDGLVAVHVVCAVVGFGAVAVSGAYGALARRLPASEEVRRYFRARGWAEYLVVATPVPGVAAMAVRPGGSDFGELWVIAGAVIWVTASTLLLRAVRPAEAVIRAGEHPASALGGRRLMWAAAVSDVLFVIALFLMVTQPT
ncbi:MAG: hypothetical protein JO337_06115 [Acidimicrobiales bacterium]|nr:hypothetical protein [Acidimicrobiales bacterium]